MGGNSSKEIKDIELYKSQFRISDITNDPIFMNFTLLKDKSSNSSLVLKEVVCKDQIDFDQEYKRLKDFQEIQHDNIISIKDVIVAEQKQLCSTIFKLYYTLQYSDVSLHDYLNKRIDYERQEKFYFSDLNLWMITIQLISALATLQKANISHGDIQPQKIIMYPEYKIIPSQFIQEDIYIKAFENLNQVNQGYFSPKQLKNLQVNQNLLNLRRRYNQQLFKNAMNGEQFKFDHDKIKSDVFSLGISLLHIGHLESCYQMFDYEKFIFNQAKLDEKFQQMENIYSEVYMNFVNLMVIIDEDERPDFIELENLLKSDNNILTELNELEEMAKMNPEIEAISPIHPKNNNLSITQDEIFQNQPQNVEQQPNDNQENILQLQTQLTFEQNNQNKDDVFQDSIQNDNSIDLKSVNDKEQNSLQQQNFEPIEQVIEQKPQRQFNLRKKSKQQQQDSPPISNQKQSNDKYGFSLGQNENPNDLYYKSNSPNNLMDKLILNYPSQGSQDNYQEFRKNQELPLIFSSKRARSPDDEGRKSHYELLSSHKIDFQSMEKVYSQYDHSQFPNIYKRYQVFQQAKDEKQAREKQERQKLNFVIKPYSSKNENPLFENEIQQSDQNLNGLLNKYGMSDFKTNFSIVTSSNSNYNSYENLHVPFQTHNRVELKLKGVQQIKEKTSNEEESQQYSKLKSHGNDYLDTGEKNENYYQYLKSDQNIVQDGEFNFQLNHLQNQNLLNQDQNQIQLDDNQMEQLSQYEKQKFSQFLEQQRHSQLVEQQKQSIVEQKRSQLHEKQKLSQQEQNPSKLSQFNQNLRNSKIKESQQLNNNIQITDNQRKLDDNSQSSRKQERLNLDQMPLKDSILAPGLNQPETRNMMTETQLILGEQGFQQTSAILTKFGFNDAINKKQIQSQANSGLYVNKVDEIIGKYREKSMQNSQNKNSSMQNSLTTNIQNIKGETAKSMIIKNVSEIIKDSKSQQMVASSQFNRNKINK